VLRSAEAQASVEALGGARTRRGKDAQRRGDAAARRRGGAAVCGSTMVQDAGMQVQTCSASIEVTIITTKSAGTLTAHRLVPSPKRRSRVATAATHVTPICTSTTPYGLPDLLTESLFKRVIPIEQAAQLTAASKASLPRAAPTSANSELRVGSSRSPCCMGSASYRVGAMKRACTGVKETG
jgi:hypothetical protein